MSGKNFDREMFTTSAWQKHISCRTNLMIKQTKCPAWKILNSSIRCLAITWVSQCWLYWPLDLLEQSSGNCKMASILFQPKCVNVISLRSTRGNHTPQSTVLSSDVQKLAKPDTFRSSIINYGNRNSFISFNNLITVTMILCYGNPPILIT